MKRCTVLLFFLVALALLIPHVSHAAPILGKIFTFPQPDGSTVQVRVWGDEFYQVVESMDGYTLVRDPKTLVICYAKLSADGNELISTGLSASFPLPADAGIEPHIRISSSSAKAKSKAARVRFAAEEKKILLRALEENPLLSPAPSSVGNVTGICILVEFPDEPGTIPHGDVDDYCNMIGYNGYGNNGSVRDYYFDVSDTMLDYTNDVFDYIMADHNKSYYDDCTKDCGPQGRELVKEMLDKLDAMGVDFSNYDENNDGVIDAINCFYAGSRGCPWAKGLWPHCSSVTFSADGVSAGKYQITDMGSALRIGTFCHENGHMLCYWPDLYDYDPPGPDHSLGVGYYCLMAYGGGGGGGFNPHEPCAYLKDDAGWANITLLTVPQADIPVTAGTNAFCKYPHPTDPGEFFMISNRQQTGRDTTLPDAGIAIWHVDETNGGRDNQQMTCLLHYVVSLEQADGLFDMENDVDAGDSTDLFDALSYNEFSGTTNPNSDWWCDGASGLKISEISELGQTMTFTFGELPNHPPVADAGPDQVVECECSTGGTVVTLDGTGSSDPDGDPLTYTWTGPFAESPANGPTPTVTLLDGCVGDYLITLVVNDGTEDSEPDDVTITVVDTTPPVITVGDMALLWPPNHKFHQFKLSDLVVSVEDICAGPLDVDVAGTIISMHSDEPENAKHHGDGNTYFDMFIWNNSSFLVRSERMMWSNGRVYSITFEVVDPSGNASVETCYVGVPPNKSGLPPVDGPPGFGYTIP